MTGDNLNRLSRRNVIRSSVALSSIGAASLFASGTGAAQSGTRGKYGYGIDDSGNLVYYGDDDDSMIASTEAMNEAKLDFAMKNGAVVIESETQPRSQPDTGGVGTLRYRAPPSETCGGKSKYNSYFASNGVRHKLWINHCDCRDIVDLLSAGVELAALAGTISALYGNIPVAVASAVALFLMRIAKSLITNNDEGEGIVLAITTTRIGNTLVGGGLEPQH